MCCQKSRFWVKIHQKGRKNSPFLNSEWRVVPEEVGIPRSEWRVVPEEVGSLDSEWRVVLLEVGSLDSEWRLLGEELAKISKIIPVLEDDFLVLQTICRSVLPPCCDYFFLHLIFIQHIHHPKKNSILVLDEIFLFLTF